MTANQIAYQANLIQQENYAAQRAETERHNKEIERIEDDKNAIQSTLGAMADQRAKEELQFKKDVQAKLQERSIANEERRTEIDQELADIKYLEETRLRWYNDETVKLSQRDQELTKEKLDLQRDFQEFQKSAKWNELGLTEQQIAIQNKNVEYQHWDRVESNAVARDSYVSQRNLDWVEFMWNKQYQQQYLANARNVAEWNYSISQRDLQLKQEQWETQRKYYNAQTFNYIVTPFVGRNGLVSGAMEGIKLFNGFVTPAAKAAKLLFK